MNLNPVEWSRAQDLLLKLVQALAPLTQRSTPVSLFLNKRFFIPPTNEDFQALAFRHPVRLLTTLHTVQKQVEELIAEMPVEGKPAAASKKEGVAPKMGEKNEATPSPPLSKQAQRLIDQVQDAIGKLCSSANIKNPEQAPLRETLKHLKPSLDRIIEAVTHEGMHSASDGPPPAFRFSLPRSPRDYILKKLIDFPDTEPHRARTTKTAEVNLEKGELRTVSREIQLERGDSREVKPQERGGEAQSLPRPGRDSNEKPLPLTGEASHQKQQSEKGVPRSVERTSLPGAPFVPDTRSLAPIRKKKKRKGFWFRDEEDDRNKS